MNADMPNSEEFIRAQALICLLMTRFQNHRCPTLAHLIVRQIRQLLAHPTVAANCAGREIYLQLLDHWQTVTASLENRRRASSPSKGLH